MYVLCVEFFRSFVPLSFARNPCTWRIDRLMRFPLNHELLQQPRPQQLKLHQPRPQQLKLQQPRPQQLKLQQPRPQQLKLQQPPLKVIFK